jgi:hypothetical protein
MKKLIVFGLIAFLLGIGGATGVAVLHHRASPGALASSLADSLAGDSIGIAEVLEGAGASALLATDGGATLADIADADADADGVVVDLPAPADSVGSQSGSAEANEATPTQTSATGAIALGGEEPAPGTTAGPLGEGRLAKIFASMQPRDAARVLEQMDDQDVVVILGMLNNRQAAAVLANLSPQRAAGISRLGVQPQRGKP